VSIMGILDLGLSDAMRAVARLRYFFIGRWRCVYQILCNHTATWKKSGTNSISTKH
jgi:hypothetical protein